MTLPGHLADVYESARQVLDATGDDQLKALGLSIEQYRVRMQRIVLLAAAAHDLGKANDHFQEMLLRKRRDQGLRHEWATLLILNRPEVREWLMVAVAGKEEDWQIAQWAIAGHHPAYNRPSPPRLAVDGAGHQIKLLVSHNDFKACLNWLGQAFGITKIPPELTADLTMPLIGSRNVFAADVQPWYREAARQWDLLNGSEKRFVAAVKNCLIAADVAGSALPREVPDKTKRAAWISEAFANAPEPGDLEWIWKHRLKGDTLREFQEQVGLSKAPVTFVRAGCGTGKTLGAYLWAANQHPLKRLYFCYPTTGTATEGYRDYLLSSEGEEEQIKARLFHGRAEVDLEIILKTGEDEAPADAEAAARIESLDAWSTPIVSCTVDTVLGIVQNNRRGLYAWPALAGASFVFDEIHAYDDKLFGAMLRFLEAMRGVPVLLMTASLPAARRKALEQCLKRIDRELEELKGPQDLENRPRYQRQGEVDDRDPLAEVTAHVKELREKAKVLWVCNTVDRAIRSAEAAKSAGLKPFIYHSRFRYEDRVAQHNKIINAFKGKGPVVAICTQVAEMSLDLSATLLVTELAPVPALIQRLGRLNRRAEEGDPTRPFIVVVPEGHLPYTPLELDAARAWLNKLGVRPLSQKQIADAWEADDAERRPAHVASAWLDGGPTTSVLELREASPGITVVMERDLAALKKYEARIKKAGQEAAKRGEKVSPQAYKLQLGEKKLVQVALPMPPPPRGLDWRSWDDWKGVPIAPDSFIDYKPERGARW
jgi:CRISPR-associated endonuclease/helicase Cas3